MKTKPAESAASVVLSDGGRVLHRPEREIIAPSDIWERHMELTAVLTQAEEGGFVALNPETGTTTQGETIEEAIDNLKDATALYLAEFPLTKGGSSGSCDVYGPRRCLNSHGSLVPKR